MALQSQNTVRRSALLIGGRQVPRTPEQPSEGSPGAEASDPRSGFKRRLGDVHVYSPNVEIPRPTYD